MSEPMQLVTKETRSKGSGDSGGGIVANIEQNTRHPIEQIERQNGIRNHVRPVEERPRAILLRLEDTPATPRNLESITERVRALNRRLADSGAPFRLRVV